MGLRVACDLDGTIADMEGALQREAERLFGANVVVRPVGRPHPDAPPDAADVGGGSRSADPTNEKKALTLKQTRQLWEHVAGIEGFWTTLKEIEPGSVVRIAELRSKHRAEVVFLTQRPDTGGEITQLQTQRWLEAHGFELPAVYVLRGSRGAAAAGLQLDIVLDDRPENCLEVATESKARPLLVWRDAIEAVPPGAARLGIETVVSIAEALQRIEETITAMPKATVMSRVRKAIGV